MASLYSPTILEHFRRPRNYDDLDSPDLAHEVYDPVCGDRIRLMLRLDDGRVMPRASRVTPAPLRKPPLHC